MTERTLRSTDLDALRLKARPLSPRTTPPRPRNGEKFIRGPIPWSWIASASQLPGKSAHVAWALWFAAGVHRSRTFPVPMNRIREIGVSRQAAYRSLQTMENAGLVALERGSGKRAVVTLLEP